MGTIILDDEGEKKYKPPAWKLIRSDLPSKRSAIYFSQVKLVAELARSLNRAVLRLFEVSDVGLIPLERFSEIWDLDEYKLFVEGLFACGFVCRDFSLDVDLSAVNGRPDEHARSWDFPALRHYLHVLQRGEKWADGTSSPILESLKSGALLKVVVRLESDKSLHERN